MLISGRTPVEHLALEMMSADLHYSAVELLHPEFASDYGIFQFAAAAAYEARKKLSHYGLGDLAVAWDDQVAEASRHSGKFFADTKRGLHGLIQHFQHLIDATHEGYFPANRPHPEADLLRDDLSVIETVSGLFMTNLGSHFLSGLPPTVLAKTEKIGSHLGQLAEGIGNVVAQVIGDSLESLHAAPGRPELRYFDGRMDVVLPRLFAGELSSPQAASLLTIGHVLATADQADYDVTCDLCAAAVGKRRFLALYHALLSIKTFVEETKPAPGHPMLELLDRQDSTWILGQAGLRRAYMHYGTEDIIGRLGPTPTVSEMVVGYTGLSDIEVTDRTKAHLHLATELVTDWMETPPAGGSSFRESLVELDPDDF